MRNKLFKNHVEGQNIKRWHEDSYDAIPLNDKVHPSNCMGKFRIPRPYCFCCGGSEGVRAGKRKEHRWVNSFHAVMWIHVHKGRKPKREWNDRDTIRNRWF